VAEFNILPDWPGCGNRAVAVSLLPADLLRHEMMRPRGATSDEFLAEIIDEVFLPLVSPAD
jgi:hypothetical protein